MTAKNILVILGSMRMGRNGERVANLLVKKLKDAGHKPVLMDVAVLPNEGKVIQPMHFHRDTEPPTWMESINKTIQDCDGFVIVTPEYNSTLPPGLTAFMDNFPPTSYSHKPAAIAAYSMGPFGGIRAAAAARPFLSELKMITTPNSLLIPEVHKKITEDLTAVDDRVNNNADKLIKELIWYSTALGEKIKTEGKPN